MVCTVCGTDGAKIFFRKVNGREVSLTLCPNCYARLYPAQESEDLFTAFVGNTQRGASDKACRVCGTTLADFRRTGLLGCADCYTAFREELFPIIYRLQGSLKHCGVVPAETAAEKYDDVRRLAYEQEELLQQITAAKGAGDRLREAELRRKLAVLNRKLYGGDTV